MTQFVEAEVAHRADEVDKTNTFPIVCASQLDALDVSMAAKEGELTTF